MEKEEKNGLTRKKKIKVTWSLHCTKIYALYNIRFSIIDCQDNEEYQLRSCFKMRTSTMGRFEELLMTIIMFSHII